MSWRSLVQRGAATGALAAILGAAGGLGCSSGTLLLPLFDPSAGCEEPFSGTWTGSMTSFVPESPGGALWGDPVAMTEFRLELCQSPAPAEQGTGGEEQVRLAGRLYIPAPFDSGARLGEGCETDPPAGAAVLTEEDAACDRYYHVAGLVDAEDAATGRVLLAWRDGTLVGEVTLTVDTTVEPYTLGFVITDAPPLGTIPVCVAVAGSLSRADPEPERCEDDGA